MDRPRKGCLEKRGIADDEDIMSNSFDYQQGRPTPVSPYSEARRVPRWRRAIGCFFLLLALGLLAASAGLVLTAPTSAGVGDDGILAATDADSTAVPTRTVDAQTTADETVDSTPADTPANMIEELPPEVMPTLSSARIAVEEHSAPLFMYTWLEKKYLSS